MNSVNVGASVTRDAVKALPVEGVTRASDLLDQNAARLADYPAQRRDGPQAARVPAQARCHARSRRSRRSSTRSTSSSEASRAHEDDHRGAAVVREGQRHARGLHARGDRRGRAAISEGVLRDSAIIEIVRRYEKLPPVLVDRHQVMQILVNLVSNAKHALEAVAAGEARADGRDREVDGGVRIEVRDNGVGIAPENLPKIFNHGFTTKKTGPRLRPAQLCERRATDGRQPHGVQRWARHGRELRAADAGGVRRRAAATHRASPKREA